MTTQAFLRFSKWGSYPKKQGQDALQISDAGLATLSNNLNSEKSIRQTADDLLADDIATERTA